MILDNDLIVIFTNPLFCSLLVFYFDILGFRYDVARWNFGLCVQGEGRVYNGTRNDHLFEILWKPS